MSKVRLELKNSPEKACDWHTRATTTQKDGTAGGRCLKHHEGRPAAAGSPNMRGICVGRRGCQSGGEKAAGRQQPSTKWGAGGWGLLRGGAADGEMGSGGGGWGAMAAGEYGIDAPVAGGASGGGACRCGGRRGRAYHAIWPARGEVDGVEEPEGGRRHLTACSASGVSAARRPQRARGAGWRAVGA